MTLPTQKPADLRCLTGGALRTDVRRLEREVTPFRRPTPARVLGWARRGHRSFDPPPR